MALNEPSFEDMERRFSLLWWPIVSGPLENCERILQSHSSPLAVTEGLKRQKDLMCFGVQGVIVLIESPLDVKKIKTYKVLIKPSQEDLKRILHDLSQSRNTHAIFLLDCIQRLSKYPWSTRYCSTDSKSTAGYMNDEVDYIYVFTELDRAIELVEIVVIRRPATLSDMKRRLATLTQGKLQLLYDTQCKNVTSKSQNTLKEMRLAANCLCKALVQITHNMKRKINSEADLTVAAAECDNSKCVGLVLYEKRLIGTDHETELDHQIISDVKKQTWMVIVLSSRYTQDSARKHDLNHINLKFGDIFVFKSELENLDKCSEFSAENTQVRKRSEISEILDDSANHEVDMGIRRGYISLARVLCSYMCMLKETKRSEDGLWQVGSLLLLEEQFHQQKYKKSPFPHLLFCLVFKSQGMNDHTQQMFITDEMKNLPEADPQCDVHSFFVKFLKTHSVSSANVHGITVGFELRMMPVRIIDTDVQVNERGGMDQRQVQSLYLLQSEITNPEESFDTVERDLTSIAPMNEDSCCYDSMSNIHDGFNADYDDRNVNSTSTNNSDVLKSTHCVSNSDESVPVPCKSENDTTEQPEVKPVLINKLVIASDLLERKDTRIMNRSTAVSKDDQSDASKKLGNFASECCQFEDKAKMKISFNHQEPKRMIKDTVQLFTSSKAREVNHLLDTIAKSETVKLESTLLPSPKEKKEDDSKNFDEALTFSQFYPLTYVPSGNCEVIVAMLKSQAGKRSHMTSVDIIHNGMENEWNRLATFFSCRPPGRVFLLPIAKAGFFLCIPSENQSNDQVKVECAFCRVTVIIKQFQGKDAMAVHREMSPRCGFVSGENVGNVSIAQNMERNASQSSSQWFTVLSQGFPKVPSTPSLAPITFHSLGQQADLSVDADGTASMAAANQLAAAHQSLTVDSHASDHSRPEQQAGSATPSVVTVPSGQTAKSTSAATSGTDAVTGTAKPVPFQTATVYRAQAQVGSPAIENRPVAGSASAPANAALTNSVSGGTARQEAPRSSPAEHSGEGEQTGGNESGGCRDNRANGQERQLVTYDDLGIFTQMPKRPDMVVKAIRINTFENWPHAQSHPPHEMAEAGFYYTGHVDLVRCFHCKGGLKTWESSDKPWVEHSRWFPRCPFVRLCKGQRFVDAVQKLNDPVTRPTITEQDVAREMHMMEEEERRNLGPDVMLFSSQPPPAPDDDPTLGALARTTLRIDAEVTVASMREVAEQLEDENEQMRDSVRCKMCQINDVNVLFLPCGHLVACAQPYHMVFVKQNEVVDERPCDIAESNELCSPALRRCAMCRQEVKGSVHVHMDYQRNSEDSTRDGNTDTGRQGTAT